MNTLRLVFAANVLVAGTVGLASLLGGASALRAVWQAQIDPASQPVRVVGAFWIAISLVSLCGLVWPRPFAAVLLVQLPAGVTAFFAVWVLVLPFVIPWRELFVRS